MRFANNNHGLRVCADDAVREDEHFCPTCQQPLILKRGKVILPHFAHFPNKPCTDTWTYEERSEWQRAWQSKFPPECQEVIVTHSQQTHRADILVGDFVILFQDTEITAKTFQEKTKYFQLGGKEVIWLVHAEEDIAAGILRMNHRDRSSMFWDHPPVTLQHLDLKANRKLHIILDMGKGNLRKVEWIAPNSNFERFIVDASFTPDLMTEEGRKDATMNQYERFDTLKDRNRPWRKKASSTNAAPDKRWHTCDKTGVYHCDQCKHCEHNLINEYRSTNEKSGTKGGLFFYCCYPRKMNEVVAGEDGKEKVVVPSIWLK